MNKKLFIMILIGILLVGVLFFVLSSRKEITFLTSSSPTTDYISTQNIRIPTTYPNPIFNNYNVTIQNGNLKITGNNWSFSLQPMFRLTNGTILTWSQIPTNIERKLWKTKVSSKKWKYGADFYNITDAQKNNFQQLILQRVAQENLTNQGVYIKNSCIVINQTLPEVKLCHDDLLANYTLPLVNRTTIVVGNLSGGWVYDSSTSTWNITFDPTITITAEEWLSNSILTNVTAETIEANYTHLNMSRDDPYNGLLVYLNFDGEIENKIGGTVYDWSYNESNGFFLSDAVSNSTNCQPGFSNCAQFDGNGDQVNLGAGDDIIEGNNELTMMAWVYNNEATSQSPERDFVIRHAAGWIRWNFNEKFDCYIQASGGDVLADDKQTSTDIRWRHVACTYDGTDVTFYIDGVIEGTASTSGTLDTGFQDVQIGKDSTIALSSWDGAIDEVMIFNQSLSQADIQDIIANQSSRFMPTGKQKVVAINITNSTTWDNLGAQNVNLSTTIQEGKDSRIEARIGQINLSTNISDAVFYTPFEWGSSANIINDRTTATLINNPIWDSTSGLNSSGAFKFDGSSTTILFPDSYMPLIGSTGFTISAWVYTDELQEGVIIGNQDGSSDSFYMKILGTGQVEIGLWNTGGTPTFLSSSETYVSINKWNHILTTWDGSTLKLWVNNTKGSNENSLSGTIRDGSGNDIRIGGRGASVFFNGTIDQILILNRTLTPTEITALYNNQSLYNDEIYYTDYQNITTDTNETFAINPEADFVLPDYKFRAGNLSSNPFYSPMIENDIFLEAFNFSTAAPPGDDTSFTVSLPTGYTQINFSNNSLNASNLNAEGQNSTDGVLFITNTGNVGLDIFLLVNQTFSNFTVFADTDNNTAGATTINTSALLLKDNLGTSSSQNIWVWLNWTNKTPQTVVSKLNVSVQQN